MPVTTFSTNLLPSRLKPITVKYKTTCPWFDTVQGALKEDVLIKHISLNAAETIDSMKNAVRQQITSIITERYDITPESLNSNSHKSGKWKVDTTVVGKQVGFKISGSRFPTMRFNVTPRDVPNQAGIPIAAREKINIIIRRGRLRSGVPNRFLARMKSGHIGVFYRKEGSKSLKIDEEFMLSVPEIITIDRMRRKLNGFIVGHFEKEFKTKMDNAKVHA